MLEETVIFETNTTNASEDRAFHEVVCVGAEAINDVVVVPYVDLGDCGVPACERFSAVPSDIVLEVVLVALSPYLVAKGKCLSLVRIANRSPGLERAVDSNSIVVDLIATTYHDMEGTLFVGSEDVVPESRSFHSQCQVLLALCSSSPDQKSSSVPTEKPLHEWNMMRMESSAPGTKNDLRPSLPCTSDRNLTSGMAYDHSA